MSDFLPAAVGFNAFHINDAVSFSKILHHAFARFVIVNFHADAVVERSGCRDDFEFAEIDDIVTVAAEIHLRFG